MNHVIVFIANYFLYLSALGALYVFIRLPRQDKINFLLTGVVGAVLALIFAKLGGMVYYDARPFVADHITPLMSHANDNGFPSDHTLLSGFLAFLVLRYSKLWGSVLLVISVMIGLARVLAGVHHIVDIIGSLVFAGLAVFVVSLVFKRTHKPFQVSSEDGAKPHA